MYARLIYEFMDLRVALQRHFMNLWISAQLQLAETIRQAGSVELG